MKYTLSMDTGRGIVLFWFQIHRISCNVLSRFVREQCFTVFDQTT